MSNHLEAILLTRLTYASRASANLDEREFKMILAKAQKNNALAGITGMLYFNKQFFLQTIEGPRSLINNLLNKLVSDNRHYDLQIIEATEIQQREWGAWAMSYATPSKKNNAVYMRYSNTASFNPYLLSASSALSFLREMRAESS